VEKYRRYKSELQISWTSQVAFHQCTQLILTEIKGILGIKHFIYQRMTLVDGRNARRKKEQSLF
jgi:hypothetical protein